MHKLDMSKEYSEEFDDLRKNRVKMSFYKYGPASVNFGEKIVNALESSERCIKKYLETGNTEYLLDAGNYIMFEYMFPSVPGAYFRATDSGESAGISGMSVREIEHFAEEDY